VEVEKDGVVVRAVRLQHGGEFGPDGLVAPGIFLFLTGVDGHDECLCGSWEEVERLTATTIR